MKFTLVKAIVLHMHAAASFFFLAPERCLALRPQLAGGILPTASSRSPGAARAVLPLALPSLPFQAAALAQVLNPEMVLLCSCRTSTPAMHVLLG